MATDPRFGPHQAMEVRHRNQLEWEFHTDTGGEILIVQYPGPNTGGRPIYDDRFNLQERRPVSAERVDR